MKQNWKKLLREGKPTDSTNLPLTNKQRTPATGEQRAVAMKQRPDIFSRNRMQLTKKQACAYLRISLSTLDRKIETGKIAVEYGEVNKFGKRAVTVILPDVVTPVTPEQSFPKCTEVPKPVAMPEPEPIAIDQETYRDSFGHRITGNAEHRYFKSRQEPRPDTAAHMNPALIGTSNVQHGTNGEPVAHAGSDNHPLNADFVPIGPQKPPHPNDNRQGFLDVIFRDIRTGWAR